MPVTEVRVGDLFRSDAQTLVNTVNCVGVMGKGIAAAFKQRFPDMFKDYVERCEQGQVRLGRPYLWTGSLPWVLNFPTKDHWRSVSRLHSIEAGLEHLLSHYEEWGIESLAVPPLGCGHGGLDWSVVGPTLKRYLDRTTIPVVMFAPHGTPSAQLELDFLSKADAEVHSTPIPSPALALIEILRRVTSQKYHPPVGRITWQKLTYFATAAGIPTGLSFERNSFGPFSAELKPLVTKLVNNGLLEERRVGRMFVQEVGRTYDDAAARRDAEIAKWDEAIDRVTDLMMRMTSTDAEMAATTHFVWRELIEDHHDVPTEADVLRGVMAWKQRRSWDPKIVGSAIRHLNWLGWIEAKPSEDLPMPRDPLLDDEDVN